MRLVVRLVGVGALACAFAACSAGSQSGSIVPVTQSLQPGAPFQSPIARLGLNYRAACDTPQPGDQDICLSLVRTDVGDGRLWTEAAATAPAGYGPAQLQAAYKLPSSSAGSGQTVALVEVGDYPTAAADLATYRTQFGLSACTVANGCFKKVGQTGGTVPAENASWAEETALDEDMVSAVCPNCHILIVEASSATNASLGTAENEAVTLGATEVSNSYGGSESGATNSAYSHAGVVITASAGDGGYAEGSLQPCSYATVVCTGGTSLVAAGNSRGYTEVVWNDLAIGNGATGSGCSSVVTKPTWQTDRGCTKRSQSDVSWDADPEHGVAVYDSTSYEGYRGWLEFGGTSVASPAISAVFALAGNARSLGTSAAQGFWRTSGANLWPITSGNNLSSRQKCGSAYLYICTAGTGADGDYSGPSGWGTPNSVAAF